jgi:hypothetical protein
MVTFSDLHSKGGFKFGRKINISLEWNKDDAL